MNYYLDTEFHEYKKKPLIGKAIDTIELISIGIVSEDEREYYAICNEFDVDEAFKNDWLFNNVLLPIGNELNDIHYDNDEPEKAKIVGQVSEFKKLIKEFGKSREQIAEEIKDFITHREFFTGGYFSKGSDLHLSEHSSHEDLMVWVENNTGLPQFYAYYADYDWVVFCWLFGRMIDLPKGFPMYCIDLKQELDNKVKSIRWDDGILPMSQGSKSVKDMLGYPEQENKHNALSDAKWNKELHEFIINKL